jgi:uncharacterized protein (DUF58 family)
MTPELFRALRRIQFQTAYLAKDILAGAYRSAFKGKGMEFEEVREYQVGDEIRTIDWNVTARMNHPYVKTFREERELSVNLVVDMSSSCRFGSGSEIKKRLMTEIAAVISFSAIKNNDKLGLIIFSDQIEKYIPPRKSQRHILRIIRELLAFKATNPRTDINKALNYFGSLQTKPSICFLISDFLCEDFSKEAALISKYHDLIAVCVRDPLEEELPPLNLVHLQDLESGETDTLDFSQKSLGTEYQNWAANSRHQLRHLMQKIGAGFIDIRTDKPYLNEIRKFFSARGRTRR